ncbi:hypothetical protein Tco_0683933 [Tanacetum coccineum]
MINLIYDPERGGKITTLEELVETFFCRFYPELYDGEDEMLDEGDNWGIDPIEFLSNVNTTLEAKNIGEYWCRIYKSGDLGVLES